jgi:hypothetical protein
MLERVKINNIIKNLREKGFIDNSIIATQNKSGSA